MAPKAPKFELKTPKGTKDWDPRDMVIRDHIFSTIKRVFEEYGGVTIDTPVFELKDILAGKYGEDSKLIFDLADQGGEICSLRYDLTVPFARWLAMNKDVQSIRRYHIAKVYRRDQPAMTKGRMREFYQCDFDIAGVYDPMYPDADIIRLTNTVFKALGWAADSFTIKLNHRKILDGIFQVCGVPEDKIRSISSAVDKLDKLPWVEVRKEMTEEKGLDGDVADKIGEWVVQKGKRELLAKLREDENLSQNKSMKEGMDDLQELFDLLEAHNSLDSVSFDLSLARGLDYYTGVIYEVVTEGSAPPSTVNPADATPAPKKGKKSSQADPDEDRSSDPSVGIGSIAAGGRYDNLVGMFMGKGQIPCVGISFGVERIFSITKARLAANDQAAPARGNKVDVFVMAFGGKGFTGLSQERISVCNTLRDAGIPAEYLYKKKPKLPAQFKAAEMNGIPFAIVLGEDELAQGKVKIKEMGLREGHPEKEGVLVDLSNVVTEVKQRIERKKVLDERARPAGGLRVVHGIRGEEVDKKPITATEPGEATSAAKPSSTPAPEGEAKVGEDKAGEEKTVEEKAEEEKATEEKSESQPSQS